MKQNQDGNIYDALKYYLQMECRQENVDSDAVYRCIPVSYIFSDIYLEKCDALPKVPSRASMTHTLIASYGLLKHMKLFKPRPAREEEILTFHAHDYIDCLRKLDKAEDDEKFTEEAEQYGLSYDCPAYSGVFEYASHVAGASLVAVQSLLMGLARVAINWPGGWHHAKRDEAAGFCYINDIVIAILKLRSKYERVLYVDLDAHHGDGVDDAFCATNKVMTVSFHKMSPGFFPGTGDIASVGISRGKYYSVNVPLKDGIQDDQYTQVFERVMTQVRMNFEPQAIVCQCGADSLVGDPVEAFNLTPSAYVTCVTHLMDWGKPLLLLGGGGYHSANTARCWTAITAAVLGQTLEKQIPEHEYFTHYGPDFELDISAGNKTNHNTDDLIEQLMSTVSDNLRHLK